MKDAGTLQIAKPAETELFQRPDICATVPNSGRPNSVRKWEAADSSETIAEMLAFTVALGDSQVGI